MLKPLLTVGALQLTAMLVMLLRTKLLALFVQALSLPFAALRCLPSCGATTVRARRARCT